MHILCVSMYVAQTLCNLCNDKFSVPFLNLKMFCFNY